MLDDTLYFILDFTNTHRQANKQANQMSKNNKNNLKSIKRMVMHLDQFAQTQCEAIAMNEHQSVHQSVSKTETTNVVRLCQKEIGMKPIQNAIKQQVNIIHLICGETM